MAQSARAGWPPTVARTARDAEPRRARRPHLFSRLTHLRAAAAPPLPARRRTAPPPRLAPSPRATIGHPPPAYPGPLAHAHVLHDSLPPAFPTSAGKPLVAPPYCRPMPPPRDRHWSPTTPFLKSLVCVHVRQDRPPSHLSPHTVAKILTASPLAIAIGHSPPAFSEPLVRLHVSQHKHRPAPFSEHPGVPRNPSHCTASPASSSSSLASAANSPRDTGLQHVDHGPPNKPTLCFPLFSLHAHQSGVWNSRLFVYASLLAGWWQSPGEITGLGLGVLNPLVSCGGLLPQRPQRSRRGHPGEQLSEAALPAVGAWRSEGGKSALGSPGRRDFLC